MPTLETHPLDPYSKDPWNLNNIPILSESMLRYNKSEISGMTVPWTYVGMILHLLLGTTRLVIVSAPRSHECSRLRQDHYTYSINYSTPS